MARYGCVVGAAVIACAVGSARADVIISWTNEATSGFNAAEKAVIHSAINCWQMVIDEFNVPGPEIVAFSITEMATAAIGYATNFVQGGASMKPLSADIVIDDGTNAAALGGFFVDPTPNLSEEFICDSNHMWYGKARAGSGAAGKIDLWNVVLHEMGHALGFAQGYTLWDAALDDTTGILSYGGGNTAKVLGVANFDQKSHLNHMDSPFDLMLSAGTFPGPGGAGTGGIGDRRGVSQKDLDILAGIFGYTVDAAALKKIPAPASVAVLLGWGLIANRRRR